MLYGLLGACVLQPMGGQYVMACEWPKCDYLC